MSKKILFISGSLGLGHITRDVALAGEIRGLYKDVEISWLAAHPATVVLEERGERLLPEASLYSDDNVPAEESARGHSLNLLNYMLKARSAWENNVKVFKKVTEKYGFDLCIGDESYEISAGISRSPEIKKSPYVIIYDFLGLRATTMRPWERAGVYIGNRNWVRIDSMRPPVADLILFSGVEEDIPDRRFGPFLPNMRRFAREHYSFAGYMLPFKKGFNSADKGSLKKALGYGPNPLIICSIGGTAIGREILELSARALPLIKKTLPEASMVLVCGPRLKDPGLRSGDGMEVKGYVPELYRHFAASDMAIVQGGGTSTLELTALKIPFIYFPIEGDCEQEISIADRAARHRAGIRMRYSKTTPETLAEAVVKNIGQKVRYEEIPADGTRRAAELIGRFL
ncbi:MAG: hypothetical protein BMS9Abin23_1119 [Thermodesulfobacteriota bacterium]|nr:MAG: hypothetical protein BMS9Abin23_1119 [Thermodesulfobacteriota bacterium]